LTSGFTAATSLVGIGSGDVLARITTVYGSSVDNDNVSSATYKMALWPETTVERINRNKNRKLLIECCRIAALIAAYEQAAAIDYLTRADVISTREELEELYNSLVLEQAKDSTAIHNDLVVSALLTDLRLATLAVLDTKELQAYRVVEVDITAPISVYSLSYLLYADKFSGSDDLVERANILRALNPTLPPERFVGTVNVLQSQQEAI
jgi:hypothetical protein